MFSHERLKVYDHALVCVANLGRHADSSMKFAIKSATKSTRSPHKTSKLQTRDRVEPVPANRYRVVMRVQFVCVEPLRSPAPSFQQKNRVFSDESSRYAAGGLCQRC